MCICVFNEQTGADLINYVLYMPLIMSIVKVII